MFNICFRCCQKAYQRMFWLLCRIWFVSSRNRLDQRKLFHRNFRLWTNQQLEKLVRGVRNNFESAYALQYESFW